MSKESLIQALQPVLEQLRGADPRDPDLAARLNGALPVAGPTLQALAALVRQGVQEGWLAEREGGGVRYGRVGRADHAGLAPFSLDAVHMNGEGPGHEHPNGEIDLCFAVEGEPRFDGYPPGFTVYPPGSWHVPTVTGGVMDILYFLPGGAIRFGPPAA